MEARSVQATADRHLVIARVTRRPDTRTLDIVLAWLGDISSAVAPVCRTPCTDSSWQAQLTAELEHAAPLLEMGRRPRGAVDPGPRSRRVRPATGPDDRYRSNAFAGGGPSARVGLVLGDQLIVFADFRVELA